MTLAEIGKRLGRKGLSQIASIAKPETILAWYRKLIAQMAPSTATTPVDRGQLEK